MKDLFDGFFEGFFPKEVRINENKNRIDEIKKLKNKIKRKDLKCETNIYIYRFYHDFWWFYQDFKSENLLFF